MLNNARSGSKQGNSPAKRPRTEALKGLRHPRPSGTARPPATPPRCRLTGAGPGWRSTAPTPRPRSPGTPPRGCPVPLAGPAHPAESCRDASAAEVSPVRRAARSSVGDPLQLIKVFSTSRKCFPAIPTAELASWPPAQPGSGILVGWGGVEQLSSVLGAQGTPPALAARHL